MEIAFVGSAIALAWISFIAFLVITRRQLQAAERAVGRAPAPAAQAAGPAKMAVDFDPAKLFESAAKLVDSLTKAGPGLASLGAAVLFLAIAAYGVQKPAPQSVGGPSKHEATPNNSSVAGTNK